MKTILIIILIYCTTSVNAKDCSDIEQAVINVERPVSKKAAAAAYKREKALGILQIRPILIADLARLNLINKETKKPWVHADALDSEKSLTMFRQYTRYWCWKKNNYSFVFIAKLWNGGPDWVNGDAKKQERLNMYWKKVSKELDLIKINHLTKQNHERN